MPEEDDADLDRADRGMGGVQTGGVKRDALSTLKTHASVDEGDLKEGQRRRGGQDVQTDER